MKEIPLTQGKVALVDDEDYERIARRRWHAQKSSRSYVWYARSSGIAMHREILHAPANRDVDHINGNGLDNQKINLRLVNQSENQQNRHRWSLNTSGYRGVCWCKKSNKWQAYIKRHGKQFHLGFHATREDAARAYDEGARQHYGFGARTNFV